MRFSLFLCGVVFGILVTGQAQAAEANIGSHDFAPSPEHPVGYRGDGTSWWPGASPVTQFHEATPTLGEMEIDTEWGTKPSKNEYLAADAKSKNIVWKTAMPSWTNGEIIVVGDRIFTYGEPDLLICVDGNDGTILWQTAVNPWACAGLPAAKAELCRNIYLHFYAVETLLRYRIHFNTCGRFIPAPTFKRITDIFFAKDLPIVLAGLKKLDPQTDYAAAAKRMQEGLASWLAKPDVDKDKNKREPGKGDKDAVYALSNLIRERLIDISGLDKKAMPLFSPWNAMCGFNPSTPLSDGEHVYVQMGQGQTACYSLDGKRMWETWLPQATIDRSQHQYGGLLLADGVLVNVLANGGKTLTGYDATTGKKVWEASIHPDGKGASSGMGGHRVVDLDGMKVIVTVAGAILRARDGKVVGRYPDLEGQDQKLHGGLAPVTGYGDIFLRNTGNGNGGGPYQAFRLQRDGDAAVAVERLWADTTGQGAWRCCRKVACTDRYAVGISNRILDLATGAVLAGELLGKGRRGKVPSDTPCYITGAQGQVVIQQDKAAGTWENRRTDGKSIVVFTMWDLSDPGKPRKASDDNILITDADPKYAGIEELIPNCWADPEFFNSSGGKPGHSMVNDGGLTPNGNRLFVRTVTALYGIGDPQKAWQ